MSNERKKILDMLAEGKITADEADRLLSALDGPATNEVSTRVVYEEKNGDKPKFLHIKVNKPNSHRHQNVDIKIPLILLKAGMKLGSLMPEHARSKFSSHLGSHGIDLGNIDSENLEGLVAALKDNPIDIDADGERVKIYCS